MLLHVRLGHTVWRFLTPGSNLGWDCLFYAHGHTAQHTDQVGVFLCIVLLNVVLQRWGAQSWSRPLPIAVTMLCRLTVAQWWGSGAVHASRAIQVWNLNNSSTLSISRWHFSVSPLTDTSSGWQWRHTLIINYYSIVIIHNGFVLMSLKGMFWDMGFCLVLQILTIIGSRLSPLAASYRL